MTDPAYSFNHHFDRAHELMESTSSHPEDVSRWIAMAQVHATLANALATADLARAR